MTTEDMKDMLDESAVAEARSMMLDKFPRLVSFFLEDAEGYISKIEDSLRMGDAQSMVPPAHTLKSSARQMGAVKLADVAMYLETESRKALGAQGSVTYLIPQVDDLKSLLERTRAAYTKLLG